MMKIARIRKSDKETYGLVQDGKVATKDDITDSTAVPIPINVRDFLFDGWIREINNNFEKISFDHQLDKNSGNLRKSDGEGNMRNNRDFRKFREFSSS